MIEESYQRYEKHNHSSHKHKRKELIIIKQTVLLTKLTNVSFFFVINCSMFEAERRHPKSAKGEFLSVTDTLCCIHDTSGISLCQCLMQLRYKPL